MTGDRTDQAAISPLARLARSESFPGLLLVGCAVVAIALANSPWAEAWNRIWHVHFALRLGDAVIDKSVVHWINDGLMVLFFFFVGLEIKHEVLDGHLQTWQKAALPVAAAIGGMVVPAGFYAWVVAAQGEFDALRGFGIPMATDIAFALGILALVGSRMPTGLKVFLASLAIADDLGAVLVIALFYTETIAWQFLGFGAAVLLASAASNRLGVRHTWPYVVYGLLLWATFLQSGVHATIAGVALAMTVPARRQLDERVFSARARELLQVFDDVGDPDHRTNAAQLVVVHELQRHAQDVQAPLQRMAHGLQPLVAHLIVPVFALANAGVDVRSGLSIAVAHPAAHGVLLGLGLGKPLGVMLATWVAHRVLGCALPAGVTWRHIHGVAWLAGIGFTMALFLDGLAFETAPASFEASKVAILVASAVAGAVGFVLLRAAAGRPG